jgi:dephospho-CoA kinase
VPESSAPRRPVIGITGAIGGGKSTVAGVFRDLGCVVSDSDAEARAALDEPGIREQLVAWWGPGILDDAGQVDRAAIAAVVFRDREQRTRLESLVHPRVHARRREIFAAAPADAPALVMDVPLLYEAGLDAECDAVVFVDAPRAIRVQRVAEGRGWSDAELARREASQMPLDDKRRRADHVLVNDGDRDRLSGRVRELLHTIVTTFTG